jgi:LGFP repeat
VCWVSPDTGAHAVSGAFRDKWQSLGGATDILGYPIAEPTKVRGSDLLQEFQGAALYSSSGQLPQLRVRIDPSTEAAIWRTPAELSFNSMKDETGRPRFEPNINWAPAWRPTSAVATRMVFPASKVRFGPFYIAISSTLNRHVPVLLTISVMARSPALYEKGTDMKYQFKGANLDLTEIGRTSVTFFEDEADSKREVYIVATLPSVLNAVQLKASITGEGAEPTFRNFPEACGSLPQFADEDLHDRDKPCLQAAVNPLKLLVPRVIPLTIIYEPPGACSFANVTNTYSVGAALTVTDLESTNINTIKDTTLLGQKLEGSNLTSYKSSETERKSEVTIKNSTSLGTRLGLPIGSTPDCSTTPTVPASRQGPGKGDVFVLLFDPPEVFWDADNLTNFLFAGDKGYPNGVTRSDPFTVAAWQLASNEGLPIQLSKEEREAILSLDPFANPNLEFEERDGLRWPKLPKRFVFLAKQPLSQGFGRDSKTMQDQVSVGKVRTAIRDVTTGSESEDLDVPTQITMEALKFELGFSAGTAAGGFLASIGSEKWSDLKEDDLKRLGEKMGDSLTDAISKFFSHTSNTTTTLTYSQSRQINKRMESELTQNFYIMNPDAPMNVAIYYDTFLGSFAFFDLGPSSH